VGVRRQPNSDGGTLNFWSQAMTNELVSQGYKHARTEDIRSSAGAPGKAIEFTTDQRGTNFTYLLAVYVNSREVIIGEAGGKTEDFNKRAEQIRQSLASVR